MITIRKKRILGITALIIILLMTGCSGNREDLSGQAVENTVSENEISEDEVSEDAMTGNEISDKEGSVNEISEDAISENEAREIVYYIDDQKDIVNLGEAFENFWVNGGYYAPREVTVGDYDDSFPIELQNILIYCNDDIWDEGDDYGLEYVADNEKITAENAGDLPYKDICAAAAADSDELLKWLWVADIDGDGNDEYAVYDFDHISEYSGLTIVKYIDGKWTAIGGKVNLNFSASVGILYYDDKFYLLMGDVLACWNDAAEIPDLSYWEADYVLGNDPCWRELEIHKTIMSYTSYEVYSSDTQDDSIDYLANIDWETLKDNGAEKISIEKGYFDTGHGSFKVGDNSCWERFYEGEKYLYVIAEDLYQRTSRRENDRALAILRQTEDGAWEIVKVYYLAANYDMQLSLKENQ